MLEDALLEVVEEDSGGAAALPVRRLLERLQAAAVHHGGRADLLGAALRRTATKRRRWRRSPRAWNGSRPSSAIPMPVDPHYVSGWRLPNVWCLDGVWPEPAERLRWRQHRPGQAAGHHLRRHRRLRDAHRVRRPAGRARGRWTRRPRRRQHSRQHRHQPVRGGPRGRLRRRPLVATGSLDVLMDDGGVRMAADGTPSPRALTFLFTDIEGSTALWPSSRRDGPGDRPPRHIGAGGDRRARGRGVRNRGNSFAAILSPRAIRDRGPGLPSSHCRPSLGRAT